MLYGVFRNEKVILKGCLGSVKEEFFRLGEETHSQSKIFTARQILRLYNPTLMLI